MRRGTAIFVTALLLAAGGLGFADERQDPMDVIVALDKSLSMVEEIQAVKDYVTETIVTELLIPRDLLILVAFFGQTQVLVAEEVTDDASRDRMRAAVQSIRADGRWTDIGAALDELERQLAAKGRSGVPKHLLLITDGKQEAPPESPYWSADGSFTHAFLDNTKTIQREGWKVQVLGIGSAADARDIAQKLSGQYTEVPDGVTAEEIAESTREFFGSMALTGEPKLTPVGRGGQATLTLSIKSTGYETAKDVTVSAIRLTAGDEIRDTVLAAAQTFQIIPEGTTEVILPLKIVPPLAAGAYASTLELVFAGEEQFVPTVLDLELVVNGAFRNNLGFILPGAALVVVGLVILALLLARRGASATLRFRLAVKEAPLAKGADLFTLKTGDELYLDETDDHLSLTPTRSKTAIARIWAAGEPGAPPVLSMEVLNPKKLVNADKIPPAPAGVEIAVRTEKGQRLHLHFEVPPGNA